MQHVHSLKVLGAFALAMMAVVAVIDLRGLPLMASYGFSTVFFYGVAAIFFLIPTGLICSELSTHYPKAGGLYAWVREAFGDRMGFFIIWLEWINNVIAFPASLSFMAVYLLYPFHIHPAYYNHTVLAIILIIVWGNTYFTSLGIKASSRLADAGAIFGTIFPAIVITILAAIWLSKGHSPQVDLHLSSLMPDFGKVNLAFFTSTLLGYSGIQVIAFHAMNVKDPHRNYPRAIFIAAIIIVAVTILASVAVAIVVPPADLKLVSGLVDGFNHFFVAFNIPEATLPLILLIVLSVLATYNTWFLGPARGLCVAAQNGFFPRTFGYLNKNEIPTHILLLQAVMLTVLSTLFLYDINSGFWVFLVLSAQVTVIMWGFIFAAAIKLRYKRHRHGHVTESPAYTIPGKNWGIWCVVICGIVVCLIGLIVSFIPPSVIKVSGVTQYEIILVVSNIIFLGIPFVIFYFMQRKK